ncbi:MAG: ATP-binding cassette domain-containing protein [Rickettsiales bacterium]|jgi:ABC-type transport system involved in cytochrome c biogenesis ATPase subunit|nr:ATP-binding cassette domain-containing protein [Rickettsiales bacterium]
MLTIENISLSLDDKVIIKELSCSFFQCSVSLLDGANKVANTLLLKTLAGLHKAYQGDILVQQNNILDSFEAYKNDINYISSRDGLKLGLSVMDNIEHWASIYETEILINTAFHFFELEELADSKIQDLTKEQRQRVSLTRLILKPTPIWYLDNPCLHLEEKMKKKFCNMIEVRAREGGIILINSENKDIPVVNNKINLSDFDPK